MSRRAAGRGMPVVGALLLGLAVLGALLPFTAAPAAARSSASPAPSTGPRGHDADDDAPLRVSITGLAPRSLQPGGLLQVTGRVTDVGDSPATHIRIRLRVGERLVSRAELDRADSDRPPTVHRSGTDTSPVLADLSPGQSTTFDLRTTVAALRLEELGVYPLDVEALGTFGGTRGPLGVAPTYLPWFAGEPVQATRVAVLWPLVDTPHRGPDEVMSDDSLAASLAPAGRLGRLLTVARAAATPVCDPPPEPPTAPADATGPAGSRSGASGTAGARLRSSPRPRARQPAVCSATPVTYAVDPDLLYTAQAMTSPYLVRAASGTVHGSGGAAADAWLGALRAAATATGVLALPYADPDVDALTRTTTGRDDVAVARDLGTKITQEVLGTTPLDTVAWPPAGSINPAGVDALTTGPTSALVLSASAFAGTPVDPGYTVGSRTPLPESTSGTALTGLVPDDGLSALLAATGAAGGPRLAEQRFLVETAMIAAERPNLSRELLLVLPRRGTVSGSATVNALRDLGRVPWSCPVSVAALAADAARCPASATAPTTGTGTTGTGTAGTGTAGTGTAAPPTAGTGTAAPVDAVHGTLATVAGRELPADYLGRVLAARTGGLQLTDAVLKPSDATSQVRSRLRRAVARAESSAWRADPAAGTRYVAALEADIAARTDRIRVRGRPLLLTSSKGTLYVSVDNTLDVPITIRVQFDSRSATLSTLQTPVIEVPAHTSVQPPVQAAARTSGQFVVVARLMDRDDQPFGAATEVVVRSTRYGRLALAVTALGAGVLLITAGVRLTRRALGLRRRA